MGTTTNPFVTMMTLFFGAVIGVIAAIAIAYYAGFIAWDRSGGSRLVMTSLTPGMDLLNEHQCRKAENKHIILGGIEDNFSTDNEEIVEHNEIQEERYRQANYKYAVSQRNYDESGMDKALVDTFLIPSRTVNGIFVTKVKLLSDLKNDSLSIGDLLDLSNSEGATSMNFQPENILDGWKSINGLISSDLANIKYIHKTAPRTFDTLLEQIKSGPDFTEIAVTIADDTMVDFIGFAVCVEPEGDNGVTYHAGVYETPRDIVSFSCKDEDQIGCDGYSGDTTCSTELPVICFKDALHKKPNLSEPLLSAAAIEILDRFWSGGEVQISTPVRGDRFETSDDVNEFCRSQFGDEWRVASHHENYSDYVIGYGSAPKNTLAWIDIKGEPYANCWKHRKDYEVSSGQ